MKNYNTKLFIDKRILESPNRSISFVIYNNNSIRDIIYYNQWASCCFDYLKYIPKRFLHFISIERFNNIEWEVLYDGKNE